MKGDYNELPRLKLAINYFSLTFELSFSAVTSGDVNFTLAHPQTLSVARTRFKDAFCFGFELVLFGHGARTFDNTDAVNSYYR